MPDHMAALFVGIPILMLIIFCVAFWLEANRSRTELRKTIQGQI
ncbi:hypothetical protein [Nostoc sp.]